MRIRRDEHLLTTNSNLARVLLALNSSCHKMERGRVGLVRSLESLKPLEGQFRAGRDKNLSVVFGKERIRRYVPIIYALKGEGFPRLRL